MKLFRAFASDSRTLLALAPHLGDFPSMGEAEEACVAHGGSCSVEPVEWNESLTDPLYTNAGDVTLVGSGDES